MPSGQGEDRSALGTQAPRQAVSPPLMPSMAYQHHQHLEGRGILPAQSLKDGWSHHLCL